MDIPRSIFITGADTGVGKTVATACLAQCLSFNYDKVSVIKPVQTGTSTQPVTDVEFVYKVMGRDFDYKEQCLYSFSEPLSPYTASQFEDITIELDSIVSWVEDHKIKNDIVIIEGAGGLAVPLSQDYLMADLAADTESAVIIVARPSLGTINHTVLTAEFARSRGLQIMGIVICNFPCNPGLSEKNNPKEMVRLSGVPVIGVIYEDQNVDVESGNIGNLRSSAAKSLSAQLGGNFDYERFCISIEPQNRQ